MGVGVVMPLALSAAIARALSANCSNVGSAAVSSWAAPGIGSLVSRAILIQVLSGGVGSSAHADHRSVVTREGRQFGHIRSPSPAHVERWAVARVSTMDNGCPVTARGTRGHTE